MNVARYLRKWISESRRDWFTSLEDAWVYGIIVGWRDRDIEKLRQFYFLPDDQIQRLRDLHEAFTLLIEDIDANPKSKKS